MAVVSVRLPDEDLAFLRERRANVSEIVRSAVQHEIRMMRHEEAMEFLARHRRPAKRPAEDWIREDRDAR